MKNRNDIRKAFEAIGYKVGFKRNPFNCNLCNITFADTEGKIVKPVTVSSGNVYSKEFFEEHNAAFELAAKLKGTFLEDTDQRIV